jgi:hypothetical protein
VQFAAEPAPATDGNLYAPVSDDRALSVSAGSVAAAVG